MLPKVESAGQVVALDLLLSQVEAEAGLPVGRTGVEVQIESALGLAHLSEICAASPRIEAVVLGPVDLAASLGMPMLTGGDVPEDYPGDHYHAVHLALVVAARVQGIQVIDGPYLRLDDPAGLAMRARRTRALGFDGKWAIHPDQVPALNAIFSPDPTQVARAEAILAALETAEADEGRGALRNEGEMLDEASRKMALAIVARAGRSDRVSPGR
jgi:citrate lyase subunit beta/citryl-CoA lyase